MRPPRGLSAEEAAAWSHLAQSVTPLAGKRRPPRPELTPPDPPVLRRDPPAPEPPEAPPRIVGGRATPPRQPGLDSHWDRRIKNGSLVPDMTLDLHGHTIDAAHGRLMDGIAQARAMGARVLLLIAGKPRPVEAADRGHARGVIRAKVLDWLAASSHAPAVAAIRKAHIRHGGDGALYIVLRKGSA